MEKTINEVFRNQVTKFKDRIALEKKKNAPGLVGINGCILGTALRIYVRATLILK